MQGAMARRLRQSLIGVAPLSKPSLGALAVYPTPGFGFGLKAGDLLGVAARPDRLYVPFVPNPEGLGIDFDLVVRFGHAGSAAPPEAPRLGSRSGVLNPTGGLPPGAAERQRDFMLRAVAKEWPLGGDLRGAGLHWPHLRSARACGQPWLGRVRRDHRSLVNHRSSR